MADTGKVKLDMIKLLVLDVDGVLTNGGLVMHDDGTESKIFNTLDGHGIKLCQRAGIQVAILSGRPSPPTNRRAKQLGIDICLTDCLDKLPKLMDVLDQLEMSLENVAYVGDDLPDLPVIREVGFGVAVANAVDEVKQEADYITARPGGAGAVRDVIEYILKNSGRWQETMNRYLPKD